MNISETSEAYFQWPHAGWWDKIEEKAKRMSIDALWYARRDCHKTALANPRSESESKYHDEGSIYAMEINRRGK